MKTELAAYRARCEEIKARREEKQAAHDRAVAKRELPDKLRAEARSKEIAGANWGLAFTYLEGTLRDRPDPRPLIAPSWPTQPDYPVRPSAPREEKDPNLLLLLAQAMERQVKVVATAEPEKESSAVVREKAKVRETAARIVREASAKQATEKRANDAALAAWRAKWL